MKKIYTKPTIWVDEIVETDCILQISSTEGNANLEYIGETNGEALVRYFGYELDE